MNFSELEFSPPAISEPDSRPDATPLFRRRLFWLLSVAAVVLFTGTWLLAQGRQGSPFPGPQPSFGDLTAAPPNVVLSTPTTVTFTIRIETPTLNPTTVQLQRVDVDGTFVAAIGRMYDNGQGGDVKAGDRIFTARVALNKSEVGSLYFRVGAAFRGNRHNAWSETSVIDVWSSVHNEQLGVTVAVPSRFISVSDTESGGRRLAFFTSPEAVTALQPAAFVVDVESFPADRSLRDYARLLGAISSSAEEVSITGRPFIRWNEDLGDGMVATFYSTRLSSTDVITVSTMSNAFATSDEFAGIVASLQY